MENMIVNLQDVDITSSQDFAAYSDFKEQLEFEQGNHPFPRTYLPQDIKSRNETLSASIAKMPPQLLKAKADELIAAQGLKRHDEMIDHLAQKRIANYNQFNNLWTPVLWQSRSDNTVSKVKIGENTIDAFDLDFLIAESLQNLYSSEDPRAEYYDWIERQQQIEININTQGTTEEEIVERNTFISFLDDRETEIKRIISLYSGAALNPHCRQQTEAQEKLKFLTFKLSELRRLRERTQATKSHADSKEYFDEQERRERTAAVRTTAALAGVALTDEMLSLGERRLLKDKDSSLLEHGIGESFVNLRPNTTTKEEAITKINTAKLNREQMIAMFTAMRNGISKEEWLRRQNQQDQPQQQSSLRQYPRNLRGFRVSDFREYSNSSSS